MTPFLLFVAVIAIYGAKLFGQITPPLRQRMQNAIPLAGKSRGELLKRLGPPKFTKTRSGGKTLLQWTDLGYRVALIFDAQDVCEGIFHQSGR